MANVSLARTSLPAVWFGKTVLDWPKPRVVADGLEIDGVVVVTVVPLSGVGWVESGKGVVKRALEGIEAVEQFIEEVIEACGVRGDNVLVGDRRADGTRRGVPVALGQCDV